MNKFFKWCGLLGGIVAISGCMSAEPLANNKNELRKEVHAGDKLDIKKTNGSQFELEVEKVDDVGLHGSGAHVPYQDISSVDREEVSWWKTGLIGAAVVAVIAVFAGSHSSGGGGGGGW